MIIFFRHLRHGLLSEEKTAKYIKYTIGEIVLVVIGILIAIKGEVKIMMPPQVK